MNDKNNAWHEEDNGSTWYRYQERMLQMRARGFCARDGVPDVLRGLYIREEIEEDRRVHEARDITPTRDESEVSPPPAPEEELKAPDAPVLTPETHFEAVSDPYDFLSDLDVSLAACRTAPQLEEVWAENLETVCGLGMQPRRKADMIYERHQSRLIGKKVEAAMFAIPCAEAPSNARPGC